MGGPPLRSGRNSARLVSNDRGCLLAVLYRLVRTRTVRALSPARERTAPGYFPQAGCLVGTECGIAKRRRGSVADELRLPVGRGHAQGSLDLRVHTGSGDQRFSACVAAD